MASCMLLIILSPFKCWSHDRARERGNVEGNCSHKFVGFYMFMSVLFNMSVFDNVFWYHE